MELNAALTTPIILVNGSSVFSEVVSSVIATVFNHCGFKARIMNGNEDIEQALMKKGYDFFVMHSEGLKLPKVCTDKTLVVLEDSKSDYITEITSFNKAVIPYTGGINTKGAKILRYALSEDEADLTAKNIHNFEDNLHFEILGTGIIGRIRIAQNSRLTVATALAAAGALLISGVSMQKLIEGINSL